MVDNGQHVILGCCNETISFLSRVGSLDNVKFFDEIEFVWGERERLRLKGSSLPAPFHLLPSLVGSANLSRSEKTALLAGLARVPLVRPGKGESARDYLMRTVRSAEALRMLIEPVLISALNEDMSDAAAVYARMVIMKTLLGGRGAGKLGVPRKSLSLLIGEPGKRYLEAHGGSVLASSGVRKLDVCTDRAMAVETDSGESRAFDYFVLAVRPWDLEAMGLESGAAGKLVWRPIVTAHLFYGADAPVADQVCVVDEPFGWLFHKREWAGMGVVYIQAVASAADGIVSAPDSAILKLALRAIARAIPELAGREPVRTIVCRSRRATFSTGGVSEALRPGPETRFKNVFLAGDWTATGWPSTLESAVRSGKKAAKCVTSG